MLILLNFFKMMSSAHKLRAYLLVDFLLALKIMILYYANFLGVNHTMKFYVEGLQLDVQDPSFFMDEENYREIKETLDEMLQTYVDLPMAQ